MIIKKILFVLLFFIVTLTNAQVLPWDGKSDVPTGNVLFQWTAYPDFENDGTNENDYYVVKIGTASGVYTYHSSGGIASTFVQYNLTLNTPQQYFWIVEAYDDGIYEAKSPGSSDYNFTTIFPPLPTPVLVTPTGGIATTSLRPLFDWTITGDTASVRYELKISTDGGNTYPTTYPGLASSDYIPTADLITSSQYYWKVEASDLSRPYSPSETAAGNFYTQFSLATPVNGLTGITIEPTLTWDDANYDSGGYTVNISTDGSSQANFDANIVATEGIAANTTTFTFDATHASGNLPLDENKKYYWQVVANNGSTDFHSDIWHFTTVQKVTITLIYPLTSIDVLATFYWYTSLVSTGSVKYKVQVDENTIIPTAAEWAAADFEKTTTSLNTSITLLGGKTYFWRVVLLNTNNEVIGHSLAKSFTTTGSGSIVVPTGSYPIGNVTVYSTAPTLYWYTCSVSTGLVFDIEYSTTGLFTGTPTVEDVPAGYKQLNNLTPGKIYYWKVRSDNGTTESDWSASYTFMIIGGITGSHPVISYPVGNPTLASTKPSVYWYLEGSSLGLTNYRIKWKEGSTSSDWNTDFDSQADINIETPNYTFVNALSSGKTYYWAVASYDGATYSSWREESFTIAGSFSGVTPILLDPIAGSTVLTKSPLLGWNVNGSTSGIQGYEVTYSNSDVFDPLVTTVIDPSTQTTLNLQLANLTAGATYYWKVRAWYGGLDYSSSSTTGNFYVTPGAAPVQPLVGGPNNVVIISNNPTLSWVLPVESSSTLTYELSISENKDFSNAQTLTELANTSTEVSNLKKGKTYYWRVRSKNESGTESYYSNAGVFNISGETTSVTKTEEVPTEFLISKNYPNPFNPSTTIKVSLSKDAFVSLKVYDILGREVTTLLNSEKGAGVYHVIWNGLDKSGNKVPSGGYICRGVINNKEFTNKMMLLK